MDNDQPFENILNDHLNRYPRIQFDDLYKLIFQAAMGSEHAVDDPHLAKRIIDDEIEDLTLEPIDPLVDRLSPDGLIVRVNLRPLLRAGGNPDTLLEAYIRTAGEHTGEQEMLQRYLDTSLAMSRSGKLPFAYDELHAHISAIEKTGFPVIHHSSIYEQAYKPAYRVIKSSLFPGLTDGSLQ